MGLAARCRWITHFRMHPLQRMCMTMRKRMGRDPVRVLRSKYLWKDVAVWVDCVDEQGLFQLRIFHQTIHLNGILAGLDMLTSSQDLPRLAIWFSKSMHFQTQGRTSRVNQSNQTEIDVHRIGFSGGDTFKLSFFVIIGVPIHQNKVAYYGGAKKETSVR